MTTSEPPLCVIVTFSPTGDGIKGRAIWHDETIFNAWFEHMEELVSFCKRLTASTDMTLVFVAERD